MLSNDGALFAWGYDQTKMGILGLGSKLFNATRPMPIKNLFDFRINSISMCESHVCASDSKGAMFSWGTGMIGELGIEEIVAYSPV